MNFYIIRGESWDGKPWHCRSAYRIYHHFGTHLVNIGFRVCCSQGDGHILRLEDQTDG